MLRALALAAALSTGTASVSDIEDKDRAARQLMKSAQTLPSPLMRLRALAAAWAFWEQRQDLANRVVEARPIPEPPFNPQKLERRLRDATAAVRFQIQVTGPAAETIRTALNEGLTGAGYQPAAPGKSDVVLRVACKVDNKGEQPAVGKRKAHWQMDASATFEIFDHRKQLQGAFEERYTLRTPRKDLGPEAAIGMLARRIKDQSPPTLDRIIKARPPS